MLEITCGLVADLAVIDSDITITQESRTAVLERVRLYNKVITLADGVSHTVLRHIYMSGPRSQVRLTKSNWHNEFNKVWVENNTLPSFDGLGWHIGDSDPNQVGLGNKFIQCLAKNCSTGVYGINQVKMSLDIVSSDANRDAGIILTECHGEFSVSTESNQGRPIRLYNCSGDLDWFCQPYSVGDILVDGDSSNVRVFPDPNTFIGRGRNKKVTKTLEDLIR